MKSKTLGLACIVLATALLGITLTDAAISSILMGGRVTVTELEGSIQYTSNPYTTWTSELSVQAGAIWRSRVDSLTVDYTGNVNLTWTLYDAGADGLIGTGDDAVIPSATFVQTVAVEAGVPVTEVASSDGFNPYNWGQWTSSPDIVVYVQLDITEG